MVGISGEILLNGRVCQTSMVRDSVMRTPRGVCKKRIRGQSSILEAEVTTEPSCISTRGELDVGVESWAVGKG